MLRPAFGTDPVGEAVNGLPPAGVAGTLLTKNSSADFDVDWLPFTYTAALQDYNNNPLSVNELQQVGKINALTISETQWGYLGGLDQSVNTTSGVVFDTVDTRTLVINRIGASGQTLDLFGDRLGSGNAYGLGVETGGYITYLSGLAGHRFYSGVQPDGTSWGMELDSAGNIFLKNKISTNGVLSIDDNGNISGDKISLLGNRFGTTSAYAIGTGPAILYYKAPVQHQWYVNTNADGGSSARMRLGNGLRVGNPTGGDRGIGTINAVSIFSNGSLVCTPLHMDVPEAMLPEYWDDLVEESPEYEAQIRQVEAISPTLTDRIVGWFTLGVVKPKVTSTTEIEEQVLVGMAEKKNRTARRFLKMVFEEGFDPRDPRNYVSRMSADRAVPGLITKEEWQERNPALTEDNIETRIVDKQSTAEIDERQTLALDCLAVSYKTTVEELEALKLRVQELENFILNSNPVEDV